MKLATKLYLFFAGIVILPLVAVTLLSSIFLGRSGEETYRTRMQSGLAAASPIVSEQDRALAGDLKASLEHADSATLVSGDSGTREAVLGTIRSETGSEAIILTDSSGQTVARAGPDTDTAPLLKSSVNLNGTTGSQWQVSALRELDSSSIANVFSLLELDWGILDGNTVTAGTLAGRTFQTAEGTAPSGALGPTDPGSSTFQAQAGGQEMVALALTLPGAVTSKPLVMVAAAPASTVGAASGRALEAGLVLTFMTLVLAVMLGLMLARTITRPLRKLNEAAASGAAGDLGRKVEIKSGDEIGGLAASFNLMQSSIRSYVNQLEESQSNLLLALSYAGDILGSTSDRNGLLKTTAEAARLATGAQGIWAGLFADAGSPGHDAISVGVPFDFFENGRERDAMALADMVGVGRAASGEIHDFPGGGVALAYPLMHGDKSLGSLVAIFPERSQLEGESKRRILNSLATQAASAVENVNFAELQQMLAVTDPMTGVSNFRSFQRSLSSEVNKSRRYRHPISLAIIDLDDFKLVNDTFGHQTGDELLKEVAKTLSRRVRDVDIVARYGGEEFAVVFPETPKSSAQTVSESLRRSIEELRLAGAPEVRVTASIGVASFPENAADEKELVGRADEALYRAKAAGKNRVIS